MDLKARKLGGFEALLRWNRPDHGLVPPLDFIPEAEGSGMIVPIGKWVLRAACRQLAEWHRSGFDEPTVAVNVSAHQLQARNIVDSVRAAISESGIRPAQLELEVTESTAFDDADLAKGVLTELANLGVRILIDDFGAGYSNLNRLRRMPIHGIKIDRLFLRDIANDPADAAIVAAVIGMAHSIGIDVVAEGIEDEAQLNALRSMRLRQQEELMCERVQGYHLGKPAPAEALHDVLRRSLPRLGESAA